MIEGKKIVVVMPAFNAGYTLKKTVQDLPIGVADEIILCDDASTNNTVEIANALKLTVVIHNKNRGYGANQKTCYKEALKTGADIVAMIHPDYQYDPRVLPAAAQFIVLDICDIVIGSRVRTRRETLQGGMPLYKYISNRFLTAIENLLLGQNLGDFHSGFRVYRREVLQSINFIYNSDDFIFDTELSAQAIHKGYKIGDIPIPTRYFREASSINFSRSIKYGLGCLSVTGKYLVQKSGLWKFRLFADVAQTCATYENKH
jgi:glycosyltransferase involved in cell wall biosynthesis